MFKPALYTITHFIRGKQLGTLPESSAMSTEDVEQYSHDQRFLMTRCTECATDFIRKNPFAKKMSIHIRPIFGQEYPGVEIYDEGATQYSHAWVIVECQKNIKPTLV